MLPIRFNPEKINYPAAEQRGICPMLMFNPIAASCGELDPNEIKVPISFGEGISRLASYARIFLRSQIAAMTSKAVQIIQVGIRLR
jgi:hypothetical protein